MDTRDSIYLDNGKAGGRIYLDEDSEDCIEFKGFEVPEGTSPQEVKDMVIDTMYEKMEKDRRKRVRLEMSRAYRAHMAAARHA
jgi:hypothetical protein